MVFKSKAGKGRMAALCSMPGSARQIASAKEIEGIKLIF